MADPPGLEILQARYGDSMHGVRVTEEIKKLVKNGALNFTVSAQTLGVLDPAPGIKKTCQVIVSINGGANTVFTAEDGEQIVINAPTIKKDDGPKSAGSQFTAVIWYILVTFIGTFFTACSYSFGAYGLGSSFLGILFALVVAAISITLGVTQSNAGPFGLLWLVLGAGGVPLSIAFMICLVDPTYINFDWAKKTIEPVVEAVAPSIE